MTGALVLAAVFGVWRRRGLAGSAWRLLLAAWLGYLAFDLPSQRLVVLALTAAVAVVVLDVAWTLAGPHPGSVQRDGGKAGIRTRGAD